MKHSKKDDKITIFIMSKEVKKEEEIITNEEDIMKEKVSL